MAYLTKQLTAASICTTYTFAFVSAISSMLSVSLFLPLHQNSITLSYMKHTLRDNTRLHQYPNFTTIQLPWDNLQYTQSMLHTLNHAFSLLTQHFNDKPCSFLTFGNPIQFSTITHDFYNNPAPHCPMEHGVLSDYLWPQLCYLSHSQQPLLGTQTLSQKALQNYQGDQVNRCCYKSVPCKNYLLNHYCIEFNLTVITSDSNNEWQWISIRHHYRVTKMLPTF